jgi:hypothetical protein
VRWSLGDEVCSGESALGGICIGEFNAIAGQSFNRLMQELRRTYGATR